MKNFTFLKEGGRGGGGESERLPGGMGAPIHKFISQLLLVNI